MAEALEADPAQRTATAEHLVAWTLANASLASAGREAAAAAVRATGS
jgi:hypothetical protein